MPHHTLNEIRVQPHVYNKFQIAQETKFKMQKSISINLGYRKPFIAIIPNTNKGKEMLTV